jgi:polar amino acid transport system substrate-binding protein
MKRIWRLGLAVIAALPLVAWGGACPAVTRIGFSDLGYSAFRGPNGDLGGISVDVAKELARRTGCNFEYLWFPRQRLFAELEAGRVDLTMGAVRAPERDAYANFLPYAYVQYDLILARKDKQQFTSLADFVARGTGRLNITRGMKYDPDIETQLEVLAGAGRLEVVNDFETVFVKLGMGRADGTLATPPIYSRYLHATGAGKVALDVLPLPESAARFIGIYASRKSVTAELRQQIAGALKALVGEQAVPVIYGRYFDEVTVKRIFRLGAAPLLNGLADGE